MDRQFEGLGLRFRYPSDWELAEELGETEASVTVRSADSAFWSVTVLRERPDPDAVLAAALDAYRDEYPELDIETFSARLVGRTVPAADIDFVCLELTSRASLRALQSDRCTLLVLSQVTDADMEEHGPILEAISESLICGADVAPT